LAKPLLGALNWMTFWYRPKSREGEAAQGEIAQRMADFILGGMKLRPGQARARKTAASAAAVS